MYAIFCTRPYICYIVSMINRYQTNPELEHYTIVRHILKYLRKTKDYMLVYESFNLILVGYIDSISC